MPGAIDPESVTHAFTLKSRWLTAAILRGAKPVENRSQLWSPGWYAVHTGVGVKGDEWAKEHVRQNATAEQWRQIQEDERANPMPQPPTNAQKIFYQVRQVVRFGLFIAAGYYVGGPIRDFLTQKATDA